METHGQFSDEHDYSVRSIADKPLINETFGMLTIDGLKEAKTHRLSYDARLYSNAERLDDLCYSFDVASRDLSSYEGVKQFGGTIDLDDIAEFPSSTSSFEGHPPIVNNQRENPHDKMLESLETIGIDLNSYKDDKGNLNITLDDIARAEMTALGVVNEAGDINAERFRGLYDADAGQLDGKTQELLSAMSYVNGNAAMYLRDSAGVPYSFDDQKVIDAGLDVLTVEGMESVQEKPGAALDSMLALSDVMDINSSVHMNAEDVASYQASKEAVASYKRAEDGESYQTSEDDAKLMSAEILSEDTLANHGALVRNIWGKTESRSNSGVAEPVPVGHGGAVGTSSVEVGHGGVGASRAEVGHGGAAGAASYMNEVGRAGSYVDRVGLALLEELKWRILRVLPDKVALLQKVRLLEKQVPQDSLLVMQVGMVKILKMLVGLPEDMRCRDVSRVLQARCCQKLVQVDNLLLQNQLRVLVVLLLVILKIRILQFQNIFLLVKAVMLNLRLLLKH